MSFKNKLTTFFNNFSLELGTAPAKHLIHLYADYIELVALFSNGSYVSSADIQDRLKDEGVLNQAYKSQDQAEENDIYEGLIDKFFKLIRERVMLFGDDYPFLIHNHDKLILKEQEHITNRNKVYIFLLLSSSLNIFNTFQSELTTEFEEICFEVLKNYLPTDAIVKSFGKTSAYQGTAVEKIKSLASDLKIDIVEKNISEIATRGTQDRGLDLIGWLPTNDSVANFLSILGQCACGKEWYKKLDETRRYEKYLEFEGLPPLHSVFVPYNLISHAKKTFFQNDEIKVPTLVFERKRILNYLIDISFFNDFESKLLVDSCLDFMEGIV